MNNGVNEQLLTTHTRFERDCYEQVFTSEGHNTHAWVKLCSTVEFVYKMTRKETNFDMWCKLTNKSCSATSVADFLTSCSDVQFPTLVKDRHIFSFRNGIYNARKDKFYRYSDGGIPSEIVSCKYFDLEFDDRVDISDDDWKSIKTPFFQSILDFQRFEPDVCNWMYILIGRLLYKLNDLDRWQVIPYLKGQASSGKSTILARVCGNFYDCTDVGVLSNNVETKFGLSAIVNKHMFIAPEIKSDLKLEQAEFQSMVSGESMSISVKHQTATSVVWSVPGIMAGNEVPGWADNAGSITRRIVLFDFTRKVINGDMDLGMKLETEMAQLLKKCNKAYHWAARKYSKENIWLKLPDYFQKTRNELTETTNVLEGFMTTLRYGPDLFMPWSQFTSAFMDHAKSINHRLTSKLTVGYFKSIFMERDLQKTSGTKSRMYRGRIMNTAWVLGVDFAESQEQQHDDPDYPDEQDITGRHQRNRGGMDGPSHDAYVVIS